MFIAGFIVNDEVTEGVRVKPRAVPRVETVGDHVLGFADAWLGDHSTEATIAYPNRPGFQVARWLSPLLRPGIRRTARKLWVDDLAYAERRYELRQRGAFPG
jgi:hypothetical protein